MTVNITESAWRRILSAIHKNPDKIGVKLILKDGGCAGTTFKFLMIDKIDEDNEYVYRNNEALLLIEKGFEDLLNDITIDFNESNIMKSSFTITNPNAKRKCGCGSSFSK